MSERSFWSRARPHLSALGGRWERVENALLCEGMPDVNYCVRGTEGWLELKWAYGLPGKRSSKGVFEFHRNHEMLPSQISWATLQGAQGGRVHILAGARGYVWLLDAVQHASSFNQYTLDQLEPFRHTEWHTVHAVLSGRAKESKRR